MPYEWGRSSSMCYPIFRTLPGLLYRWNAAKALIELADRYGVPLVEDDPYGQLRYEGDHIPPLVVLDGQYRNNVGETYHGNVIYLSTFSKTLAPGLRLAWVTAPAEVIRKLVQAKQGADLHTSTFNQMVAYEAAKGGFLNKHIKTIRDIYGERRLVMLDALKAHFPPGVKWTRPQGGYVFMGDFTARDGCSGCAAKSG